MTLKAPNSQANAGKEPIEKVETTSVRDSIKAAMDEHKEEDKKEKVVDDKVEKVEDDKDEKQETTEKVEDDKDDKSSDDKKEDDKSEDDESGDEDKGEKLAKPDKDKGGKLPTPYGIPKEAREKWRDLPADIQEIIINTQKKAINDTKAEVGRQSNDSREIEAVLTPYRPGIQKAGVTAASIVKRILEYTDGLAGPNKYVMLQQIANDFSIDLTRYGKPSKPTQGQSQDAQTDAEGEVIIDLPPEVHQKLDTILSKFEENNTSQQNAQLETNRKAAEGVVHAWSGFDPATGDHKNKRFFPYVRQSMFALMKASPEKYATADNRVDLDKVYEDACYADTEIRELMLEDARLAKAQESQKLKEKKTKEIAAAKAKGISLKPSASSIGGGSSSQRNGSGKAPKGPTSVRDSILSAIQENR